MVHGDLLRHKSLIKANVTEQLQELRLERKSHLQ